MTSHGSVHSQARVPHGAAGGKSLGHYTYRPPSGMPTQVPSAHSQLSRGATKTAGVLRKGHTATWLESARNTAALSSVASPMSRYRITLPRGRRALRTLRPSPRLDILSRLDALGARTCRRGRVPSADRPRAPCTQRGRSSPRDILGNLWGLGREKKGALTGGSLSSRRPSRRSPRPAQRRPRNSSCPRSRTLQLARPCLSPSSSPRARRPPLSPPWSSQLP